jgi:hypothetical protein
MRMQLKIYLAGRSKLDSNDPYARDGKMASSLQDKMQTSKVKGLLNSINLGESPKRYKEAMLLEDSAEWAEACNNGLGFLSIQ